MHKDGLMARGTVNLVLRNEQGKVKQHKTVRNKITEQGLAHIVGRMIDSGEDRVGYTGFPTMMKFMGLGTGSTSTIDGITSAAAPAGTNEILERECTVGTVANAAATSGYDDPANPGTPLVTYQTGRVDMSRTANVNADSGGTGHSENKIYQAVENPAAPGVLQEDTGVSPEGSYDNSTGAVETVNSVAQTRKTGDRLVYRAFFGENHPSLTGHTNGSGAATSAGSAVSLPITEAGIFNKQAMIKADGTVGGGSNAGLNKDQSMLCRTRFKQVNKAPQDSLQVTWSIKIADQT